MRALDMITDEVRQAHTDLICVNEEIRANFADLAGTVLRKYLARFDSSALRTQIRQFGDGYTLRSVPRRMEEILNADDIVLIVMNSPKLDHDSVFDPHTNLVDIPYWRDGKSLQDEVDMPDGSFRKLLFLVWEQDCPVHGKNDRWGRSDRDARKMESLLCNRLPGLSTLMSEQREKSLRLLRTCTEWLVDRDRKLIVVTSQRQNLAPPIPQLLRNCDVSHLRTADLFSPNPCVMNITRREVIRLQSLMSSGS